MYDQEREEHYEQVARENAVLRLVKLGVEEAGRLHTPPFWGYTCPQPMTDWVAKHWVYVMAGAANSPIKIGISRNPKQRVASLAAGNPDIRLVAKRQVRGCMAKKVEMHVHRRFEAHSIGREWFKLRVSDVLPAIVEEIARSNAAALQWARIARDVDHGLAVHESRWMRRRISRDIAAPALASGT
jgi:hypothetical protein